MPQYSKPGWKGQATATALLHSLQFPLATSESLRAKEIHLSCILTQARMRVLYLQVSVEAKLVFQLPESHRQQKSGLKKRMFFALSMTYK